VSTVLAVNADFVGVDGTKVTDYIDLLGNHFYVPYYAESGYVDINYTLSAGNLSGINPPYWSPGGGDDRNAYANLIIPGADVIVDAAVINRAPAIGSLWLIARSTTKYGDWSGHSTPNLATRVYAQIDFTSSNATLYLVDQVAGVYVNSVNKQISSVNGVSSTYLLTITGNVAKLTVNGVDQLTLTVTVLAAGYAGWSGAVWGGGNFPGDTQLMYFKVTYETPAPTPVPFWTEYTAVTEADALPVGLIRDASSLIVPVQVPLRPPREPELSPLLRAPGHPARLLVPTPPVERQRIPPRIVPALLTPSPRVVVEPYVLTDFLLDNFNGSGLLSAHTPDVGPSWRAGTGTAADMVDFQQATVSGGKVLYFDNSGLGNAGGMYAISGVTPPSVDYYVEGVFTILGGLAHAYYADVFLRAIQGGVDFPYWSKQYSLEVQVNDPPTGNMKVTLFGYQSYGFPGFISLGSTTMIFGDQTSIKMRLEAEGTNIRAFINDVKIFDVVNAAVTAAGSCGFYLVPYTESANCNITSFKAGPLGVVVPPAFWTENVAATEIDS
jgi:hypothetical protein